MPEDQQRTGATMTLLVASLGTLLLLINYTSPLTTLAPTAASLHAGLTSQTWVLTGTLVGLAALLLTMGSVADDHGRKRVFIAGAVVLALSTALAGSAAGIGVFVAARIVQGCASAALLAPSLGLVAHAFPAGPGRVRATGVWGAAVGLGIAVGPVYAAGLNAVFGWRSVYWVLAGLSAVLVVLAAVSLQDSRSDRPRRLDPIGVLTLGGGTSCLIAGLSEGRYGWGRPAVLVLLGAGLVLMAAFVATEARVREPMLDLSLFRSPGFLVAVTGATFTGLSLVGFMSYLPTILQKSMGLSPLAASLVLGVWSGLSFVFALQARRLPLVVSPSVQVGVSLLVCGVGEAALFGMRADRSYWWLLPGLAIAGVGSGVLNAALARLAVGSVPPDRASMGSGANNAARYIGSALGVAVMVTIVAQADPAGSPAATMAAGANDAVVAAALLCGVGALISLTTWYAEVRTARRTGPAPIAVEHTTV
jgi:MFS family permease